MFRPVPGGPFVCKPTKPCRGAPAEYRLSPDRAVEEMHAALIGLYSSSAKGVVNGELYVEAYNAIRERHPLPPEYTGGRAPPSRFHPDSPAPLVMWPLTRTDTM